MLIDILHLMQFNSWRLIVRHFIILVSIFVCGCNFDKSSDSSLSERDSMSVLQVQDVTPIFIKKIQLKVSDTNAIKSISVEVEPKPGAVASAIKATYNIEYLKSNSLIDDGAGLITIPVFGLYSNYNNQVRIDGAYIDNSHDVVVQNISTPQFVDQNSVYDDISLISQASILNRPSFSYFYIKSSYSYPVIIDVDGEVRWQLDNGVSAVSSYYENGGFLIGSQTNPAQMHRVELDGKVTQPGGVTSTEASNFHHELSKGKEGYFAEVDAKDAQTNIIESTLLEIDQFGNVIKKWDMASLFKNVISSAGEDPSNFVRDGIDWFHMNSAIYSAHDDSIIISSRENFVIKIDYETGALKWILGDPTKHWYQDYPSLRSYAVTLTAGRYPIGQHALSILNDGRLMLFNNGRESFNYPAGTSAGEARDYSPVSVYSIDEQNLTAIESFSIDNNREVFSDICSSAYQDESGDFLVSYAVANNRANAKLVGFNSSGEKLFDYEMPTLWCNTSWNANFIDMSNLVFE